LTAEWRSHLGGPWVALEPNIVAYDMDAGIEHWNLWYHPSTTPGTADLDMQPGSVVDVRCGSSTRRGIVRAVRGWAADPACKLVVATGDGEELLVPRVDVQPVGWAAVLQHVKVFLPELCDEEVVLFQNVPEMRSIPEVAHAHVFIRPNSASTRCALKEIRRRWRMRSPWAEAERLGGRGSEVGYEE
jgi:hypothetical protein